MTKVGQDWGDIRNKDLGASCHRGFIPVWPLPRAEDSTVAMVTDEKGKRIDRLVRSKAQVRTIYSLANTYGAI